MTLQEKIQILMQIITLLGVVFAVYLYFRKPQETSEINDAVFEIKFKSLEKMLQKIELNDLHELKGMFNTHITNQAVHEREVASRLGGIEAKIDVLISKQ